MSWPNCRLVDHEENIYWAILLKHYIFFYFCIHVCQSREDHISLNHRPRDRVAFATGTKSHVCFEFLSFFPYINPILSVFSFIT